MFSCARPTPSEWIVLFDGKSTAGWHSYGRDTVGHAWKIEDGAFHLVPSTEKNNYQTRDGGDLVTDSEFENFELELEWKIGRNGNSGIILYVEEDTSLYKETWNTGIECQVLDIVGNEDSHSPKHDVGDLYDLVPASSHPAKPFGEWNKVFIRSIHGKLDIYLNEKQILSATLWNDEWNNLIRNSKFKDMPDFGTFRKGKIALQDHGDEVWYRNIRLKEL